MATTRIKNLNTASTLAEDDYIAIDGATNGTRKILATECRGIEDVQIDNGSSIDNPSIVTNGIATIPIMEGCTSSTGSKPGLVPPSDPGEDYYLLGADGYFHSLGLYIDGVDIELATTDDGTYSTITLPKAADDQWGLVKVTDGNPEGSNKFMGVITRGDGERLTVPRLNSEYMIDVGLLPEATSSSNGAMSAADKAKLDSLDTEQWNAKAYSTTYTDFSKTGGRQGYALVLANASDATTHNAMRIKAYYEDESTYGWKYPLVITGFYVNATSGIIRVTVKSIDSLSDATTGPSYFASGKVHFYTPFAVSEVQIDH